MLDFGIEDSYECIREFVIAKLTEDSQVASPHLFNAERRRSKYNYFRLQRSDFAIINESFNKRILEPSVDFALNRIFS